MIQFREKFKRLEKRDLVKSRLNEGLVTRRQLEYMKDYTGMSADLEKVGVDESSHVYTEIRNLIQRNEQRRKELEKEGKPLLEREFNRIL